MASSTPETRSSTAGPELAAWIGLVLVLTATALVRYRLVDLPLERDEGEYAYAGALMLDGVPPYEELFNVKLPGIYAAYAGLIAVLGPSHQGIHLGLLFLNVATGLIVFLLNKRLHSPLAGLAAAATFVVLAAGQRIQGMFANAEHFVILPATAGLLLMVKALDEDRRGLLVTSGLLLGLAVVVKQPGAAFAACGLLYLVLRDLFGDVASPRRIVADVTYFSAGVIAPYLLTCLLLAAAGVFESFWFWTFEYARTYMSQAPLSEAWPELKRKAIWIGAAAWPLWLLALAGATSPSWEKSARSRVLFLGPFVLFAFLAICPGFNFRPHYFLLTLPAAATLAGFAIGSLRNQLRARAGMGGAAGAVPLLILGAILAFPIYQQRAFLFRMSAEEATRLTYGPNPFFESLQIARVVEERTAPGDRIAIIGSEPQIFFYSDRRSATPHVYMYLLTAGDDFARELQETVIRDIERAEPKMLLFVQVHYSMPRWARTHTRIFDWFDRYSEEHYRRVGLVEMFPDRAVYHWDENVPPRPRSSNWVEVLQRKPAHDARR